MKRRLPTINQGESVLVATSLPPLTADANRHRPIAAHPGSDSAASHDALIASNAQHSTSTAGASI